MTDHIIEPTTVTWILLIFGAAMLVPLALAQLVILLIPRSRLAIDLLVGKNQSWRDDTHFRLAYGCAWGDWLILLPLATVGSVAVINGHPWGYLLWAVAGAITLYINAVLWFVERQYVMPAFGALAYYTYYWGFFMVWGAAAFCYALLRLNGITI
jgi:hypothetical protein